jgi:ferrous iron transport protein A
MSAPGSDARSISLDRVAVGRSARVADVTGADATSLRLLEMGLTPGVSVRVVAHAPLGDPLELEVRGYRLSLRRSDAARVAVAAP